MEKLLQEYTLSILFSNSLEREELLLRKYTDYYPDIKNKELKDTINEFKKNSQEHIKILNDKMAKLNIQR